LLKLHPKLALPKSKILATSLGVNDVNDDNIKDYDKKYDGSNLADLFQ